jgi:RNA polymerase subunit RPABC4/transcription elongation factor Spt4
VTHVQKDDDLVYATKRCPECFAYTELDAKRCPMCKTRLGKVQKHGMAKRTVNWSAYVVFLVAFLAFAAYMWWAFF